MRILVITNDFPPQIGGIQYYVNELCHGLAGAGDDVIVYASESAGWQEWDAQAPFRVIRERTEMLLPTPLVRKHVDRVIERYEPDVVIFGATFPLGLLGPHIQATYGIPYMGWTHGLEVSTRRLPGGPSILRRIGVSAASISFVSNWCDAELRSSFGPGPRYILMSPGVDPIEFHDGVSGAAVREAYGFGDDPVVVCVSRVVERKGQDQLIRGLNRLREFVPGTQLLIVGDGPFLPELRLLARQFGVEEFVHFTGQVDDADLPAHFAAGDVFAMPCRERQGGREVEAFGIVFIQAQAIGRPVVAGNIGGVPDTLINGETGLLVDGRDLDDIVRALSNILSDPERATHMGATASKWVRATFAWEHRVTQLRRELMNMLDHPTALNSTTVLNPTTAR